MSSTKCELDVSFSIAGSPAALATMTQSGKRHTSTRTGSAACLHSGSCGFCWRMCCGPLGAAAPSHVAFNLGLHQFLNQFYKPSSMTVCMHREVSPRP